MAQLRLTRAIIGHSYGKEIASGCLLLGGNPEGAPQTTRGSAPGAVVAPSTEYTIRVAVVQTVCTERHNLEKND